MHALCAALLAGALGAAKVQASGSVAARGAGAAVFAATDAGAPTTAGLYGAPAWTLLTEANLQLRVAIADGYDVFGDLSLFVNRQSDASGSLGSLPAPGNLLVPSELYVNLGFHEHLHGLVGRKRVVFGSGFAWNPSDLLNPPKDPTDPTFQRAGAWMVRAEAPFERFTLTALWAPRVTATEAGFPRRFLSTGGAGDAQQLFAVRAYALLADADLSLAWLWSNRFADALPHSHRLAASFSRAVFADAEVHVEAIAQRGRDATLLDPACLPGADGDPAPALACAREGRAVQSQPDLASRALYAKAVAGGRYTFADESLLSVEYYFNGPGLTRGEFADRLQVLGRLPALSPLAARLPAGAASGLTDPAALLGATASAGEPARFSFDPARRHYLFVVYQKPKIADDFTASATLIAGLEDLSGLLSPGLSWSAREWLSLALFAYVPFGGADSELGQLPFRFRAALEVRAFY